MIHSHGPPPVPSAKRNTKTTEKSKPGWLPTPSQVHVGAKVNTLSQQDRQDKQQPKIRGHRLPREHHHPTSA